MTKASMNPGDFILLNKTEKDKKGLLLFTGAIVLLKTRINRSNCGTKIQIHRVQIHRGTNLRCMRSLNTRDMLFSDRVRAF